MLCNWRDSSDAITCLSPMIIVSYHALDDLGDIVRFEEIFMCIV